MRTRPFEAFHASRACRQGAKLSFEELEIPDLDLIKQAQQGAGWARAVLRGRLGNPASWPKSCHDHVNRSARALLADEGEALTRKAVSRAGALAASARSRAPEPILQMLHDTVAIVWIRRPPIDEAGNAPIIV